MCESFFSIFSKSQLNGVVTKKSWYNGKILPIFANTFPVEYSSKKRCGPKIDGRSGNSYLGLQLDGEIWQSGIAQPEITGVECMVPQKKSNLVGGLEHEFYFSIYWEYSSQLTNTFQRD